MEIIRLDNVDSTNDEAFRLSVTKPLPFIVIAERQLAGRGQGNHTWCSDDPRNLYWTLIWLPRQTPQAFQDCSTRVAIFLSQKLREHYRIPVTIKYPNDLMIQGRKLGGILTETRILSGNLLLTACGIGLNVNGDINAYPDDIRAHCCRLCDWVPEPLALREVEILLEEIFSKHFL
jgi:BirA family biotin operon repressor/biotin-[acetyl-CoA-carboxylase] ligase